MGAIMTSQIVEEQILTINKLPKSFIYKDKSVGTFGGEGLYIRQEELEVWIRSFASTLIEKVGSELIGEDEQHESGSNTMDDEKVTRNDFRASQRTKLREMR